MPPNSGANLASDPLQPSPEFQLPMPSPEAVQRYREYTRKLGPATYQGGPPSSPPTFFSPDEGPIRNPSAGDAEAGNKVGTSPRLDSPEGRRDLPTAAPSTASFRYLTQQNRIRAQAVLKNQPPADAEHGLVKLRTQQRRQLGQLGLFEANPKVQYIVNDVTHDHGREVLLAGASRSVGLLPEGTDVLLKHPDISNAEQEQMLRSSVIPEGIDNSTFQETMESYRRVRKENLFMTVFEVYQLAEEASQVGGARVRIVNESFGFSPENYASMLAQRMLLAPPGTPLHETATKVLGRDPNYHKWRTERDASPTRVEMENASRDARMLKTELIYPAMRHIHNDPEHAAKEGAARVNLWSAYGAAAEAGILFVQASGNDFLRAGQAGDIAQSLSLINGIPGPLDVGSVQIGQDPLDPSDDRFSAVSSSEGAEVLGVGEGVPVGPPGPNGYPTNASGSSFAAPSVAAMGYLVSSEIERSNPELTPKQIVVRTFQTLADRRALIPVAAAGFANGQVDPVRAAMIAKVPDITAAQIEKNIRKLNDFPDSSFSLLPDGTMRIHPD